MQVLKITEYSNYTNIYQLLYLEFKNHFIYLSILIISSTISLLIEGLDFRLSLFMIALLTGVVVYLLPIISEILRHGPKRLVCQVDQKEIITMNNETVPIGSISTIEFLVKNNIQGNKVCDIALIHKLKTRSQLFIEVPLKEMVLIHQTLQSYLDIPYSYIEAGGFKHDIHHSHIDDLL